MADQRHRPRGRDLISISTASRMIARTTGRSNPQAVARLAKTGRLRTTTRNGKTLTTPAWVRAHLRQVAQEGGAR